MRYTWYENYPNNRLIVDGVDLSVRFRMVLNDGYTLNPPAPKTYTVDITGGNGVIDLTESLLGDVVFSNRSQSFTFWILDQQNETDFEQVKTELANFLQGKYYDYQMTMDPGYTYHGRFTIGTWTHEAMGTGILGEIVIDVDADPYKTKDECSYELNATGGREYNFISGRRKVHPLLTCDEVCTVNWQGEEFTVPAGTYRLNSVLFEEGVNTIYLNSHKLQLMLWSDFMENGSNPLKWDTSEIESTAVYYYYIEREEATQSDPMLDSDDEEILDSDDEAVLSSDSVELNAKIEESEYTWDDLLALRGWTQSEWSQYSGLDDYNEFIAEYNAFWTKTVTTWSDGTTTYSFLFMYTDDYDGATETEELYATTTDDSWPTIWLESDLLGAWSDTKPSLSSTMYLWIRTVNTYSDGTQTRAYSVESPYDIESTVVEYAADDDGWNVPDSTWSTEKPDVSGVPFIWTKTEETDSQGCLCTSYEVEYVYAVEEGADIETADYSFIVVVYDDADDDMLERMLVEGDDYGGYLVYDDLQSSYSEDILTSEGETIEITVLYQMWGDDESEAIVAYKNYYANDIIDDYFTVQKIVYTYTDGVQTVSYSALLYSDDVEVVSTSTIYCGSSSGTDYPDGDWVSSESSIDSDAEFIWEKTVTTYSDGRTVVTALTSTYLLGEEDVPFLVESEVKYQVSYSGYEITGMTSGTYQWTSTVETAEDGTIVGAEYTQTLNAIAASNYRWDELQLLYEGEDGYTRSWSDVDDCLWEDLMGTWDDVDYRDPDIPDTTVILEYEWEDI